MLETAIKAAKLAGEKLEYYFETLLEHEEKADKSFVTKADTEADQIIIDHIQANFPSHQILTEENGTIGEESEYIWVVDPLDGTLNFTRGIPFFCTSIAVVHKGEPIVSVIYNSVTRSLFQAEAGKGAFLNGEKITVSEISDTKDAIVSLGRARDPENKIKALSFYNKIYHALKSQRILGSAALELAFVASGRLEGFISVGLQGWDCFGGVLLVKEAGGQVTDFSGKDWSNQDKYFLASNGRIHDQVLALLRNN